MNKVFAEFNLSFLKGDRAIGQAGYSLLKDKNTGAAKGFQYSDFRKTGRIPGHFKNRVPIHSSDDPKGFAAAMTDWAGTDGNACFVGSACALLPVKRQCVEWDCDDECDQ